MVIGILQFELFIHGAESLKDKRRVVSSVKDRIHREHLAAVAEVALQDNMSVARLALAIVGSDGKHIGQTLDRITSELRRTPGAELGDVSREVLHDPQGDPRLDPPNPRSQLASDETLAAEMRAQALTFLDQAPNDGPQEHPR